MAGARRKYRILSLDGGGVRGLISAIWSAELERRLEAPLRRHFDLVAGTSTGAVLACGISLGRPAVELVKLFRERGREIFPGRASRLWSRARRVLSEGLSAPRYSPDGLEAVLNDVFGDVRFGKLRIRPTLVTSYDTLHRRAIVFKNTRRAHAALKVADVCRASTAAPTYFPAHELEIDSTPVPLIDGGVVASNPTVCGIAEAARRMRRGGREFVLGRLVVASIGTGQHTRPIPAESAREWGAVEWAVPIIDVLLDGSQDATDYIARHLLSKQRYFRFQTPLLEAFDDLDDASTTNVKALVELAEDYVHRKEVQASLTRLIRLLR